MHLIGYRLKHLQGNAWSRVAVDADNDDHCDTDDDALGGWCITLGDRLACIGGYSGAKKDTSRDDEDKDHCNYDQDAQMILLTIISVIWVSETLDLKGNILVPAFPPFPINVYTLSLSLFFSLSFEKL